MRVEHLAALYGALQLSTSADALQIGGPAAVRFPAQKMTTPSVSMAAGEGGPATWLDSLKRVFVPEETVQEVTRLKHPRKTCLLYTSPSPRDS